VIWFSVEFGQTSPLANFIDDARVKTEFVPVRAEQSVPGRTISTIA
jgi:hypothetical protein